MDGFMERVVAGSTKAEAEPVAGAVYNRRLRDIMISKTRETVCDSCFEPPTRWHFLVFKPFNKAYDKNTEWYTKKGLDYVRRLISDSHILFITKETMSAKEHINVMVACNDLKEFDGQVTPNNKYKIYTKPLKDIGHRITVYNYITKESKERPYFQYIDWVMSIGKNFNPLNSPRVPIIHQRLV